MRKPNVKRAPRPPHTGWPPGLLQDDCRELSIWFASRLGSRQIVRQVSQEIKQE